MCINAKVVEPGRTKGGAVCNSLLKALYDFENGDVMIHDGAELQRSDLSIDAAGVGHCDRDPHYLQAQAG